MKSLFVLTVMALHMAGTSVAASAHSAEVRKAEARWIVSWTRTDRSIYPAIHRAAFIFRTDENTLRTIVGREGGNINPRTLRYSLCHATQPGWNVGGSYAFGPFQFMLGTKPACYGSWGTFGTYYRAAFSSAKRLGHPIPFRFAHPASNVGQAITAAYMIVNGGIHHWCASMC